jgi:LysR family transcriptional regulator, low CO2-responsive transcriptional regulator
MNLYGWRMLPEALDLKKLKAFQLAARHGSLRVVAARLRLTIPAISFQIRRLEEELETQLFHRLPNGLVLTVAGEHFVREVDGIFETVEGALATLPSKAPPSGRLAIATSSDVVWYFAPRISSFIKRYPRVRLQYCIYHSKEIVARMSRGDLDVGIGYFTPPPKALEREVIAQTNLSLVCAPGHPLLRRRPLRLNDIARYRVLVLPQHSETRKIIDRVFSKAGVKLEDVIEAGNCQTARDFAERGVGVAIVHSICMEHKSSEHLRYIDLGNQFSKIEFSVIYQKDAPLNPAVAGFLETLQG